MVRLLTQSFSSYPVKTTLGVAINLGGFIALIAHLAGSL